MQTTLDVSSSADLPNEQREFVFEQMTPRLPEVLEHVEAVKARLERQA